MLISVLANEDASNGLQLSTLLSNPLYLMPPALQDWLPEGDLAWFLLDAVAQMDLSAIEEPIGGDRWSQAVYGTTMMVALLLYAYCLGEHSSRQIERLCERDIAFRVLAANQHPDHTTVSRFRKTQATRWQPCSSTSCASVRRLAVKVCVMALDGTKKQVDAALVAKRTAEAITESVQLMLLEAQGVDEA